MKIAVILSLFNHFFSSGTGIAIAIFGGLVVLLALYLILSYLNDNKK